MSKSNITNDLSKARTRANLIKNETQEGKNDHTRVGEGLNYILDCIQDNANDITALENGGTPGGGNVTVTSYYPSTGEHIADIKVGNNPATGIYAPKSDTPANLKEPLISINNMNRGPQGAGKILVSTANGWTYANRSTDGGGSTVEYVDEYGASGIRVGNIKIDGDDNPIYVPKGGVDPDPTTRGRLRNYFLNVLHGVGDSNVPDTPTINDYYSDSHGGYFEINNGLNQRWVPINENPTLDEDTWLLIVWFNGDQIDEITGKVKIYDCRTGGGLNSNGADGELIEWIYLRRDSELSDTAYDNLKEYLLECCVGGDNENDGKKRISLDEDDPTYESGHSFDEEDVVPDSINWGIWTDSPTGIEREHPIEYAAFRVSKNGEDGKRVWGESGFCAPFIWSRWGERGQDGDGVEYIFCVGDYATISLGALNPANWNSSSSADRYNRLFADDEYVGPQPDSATIKWYDNPIDLSNEASGTQEWVSMRKKKVPSEGTEAVWGQFSPPALWAYKAADGLARGFIVDLSNENMPVGTDDEGTVSSYTNLCKVLAFYNGAKMSCVGANPSSAPELFETNNFYYVIGTPEPSNSSISSANGSITITPNLSSIEDFEVNLTNITHFNEGMYTVPITFYLPGESQGNPVTMVKNLSIYGIATGEAGQTIDLYTSTEYIRQDYWGANTPVPLQIELGVRIGKGDDISLYTGSAANEHGYYFKYYYVDDGVQSSKSDYVNTISNLSKWTADPKQHSRYIVVEMYRVAGGTSKLIDTETIHYIKDGAPGVGIDAVTYNINMISTSITKNAETNKVEGNLKFKVTKRDGNTLCTLENTTWTVEGNSGINKQMDDNEVLEVYITGVKVIPTWDRSNKYFVAEASTNTVVSSPCSLILLRRSTGTPLVSIVVPMIMPGAKGDSSVQGINGVVLRFKNWTDIGSNEYIRTGKTAENGVLYKDIILYDNDYYYRPPSLNDAIKSNLNAPASNGVVNDGWIRFNLMSDAVFQALLAKYAFIENLTAREIVVTDDHNNPVAGITQGTAIPGDYTASLVPDSYRQSGNNGSARIWAGFEDSNENLLSSKFYVTDKGFLHSENADITGSILATSFEVKRSNNTVIPVDTTNTSIVFTTYTNSLGAQYSGIQNAGLQDGDPVGILYDKNGNAKYFFDFAPVRNVDSAFDVLPTYDIRLANNGANKISIDFGNVYYKVHSEDSARDGKYVIAPRSGSALATTTEISGVDHCVRRGVVTALKYDSSSRKYYFASFTVWRKISISSGVIQLFNRGYVTEGEVCGASITSYVATSQSGSISADDIYETLTAQQPAPMMVGDPYYNLGYATPGTSSGAITLGLLQNALGGGRTLINGNVFSSELPSTIGLQNAPEGFFFEEPEP